MTHTQNSGSIVIQEPGFYEVSFHGTFGSVSGADFPSTVSVYLEQQGQVVPGTNVQHTFHTTSDTSGLSFSQIVNVSEVPATLEIIGQGTDWFYSGITLTVNRLGGDGTES
ncbi:hypothetical protein [Lachnoclostridium sp. An169]|uniref:hypothetical protein n=1 Tax=Lachnoclostridium sp. An169 TaxID=1965569 RepID=UPI001FA1A010|nr:hypothetical protein [Lachnoclostridium sp. An169]HJA66443.1 hypothetical protein [Candidatus Mediterraneibacter cottocaccae]